MKAVMAGAIMALSITTPEAAEDADSANYMMPACRAVLGLNHSAAVPDAEQQAFCLGMVRGIVFMGSILRDQVKAEGDQRLPCISPPSGVTYGQSLRVVVAYIDAMPARMHEHFGVLALEALRKAWPCE